MLGKFLTLEKRHMLCYDADIMSNVLHLAEDYARCARWAVDSGADCLETNFSCPNVSTSDGQLFQQHESAAVIAARVREEIGDTPYILKVGHVREAEAVNLEVLRRAHVQMSGGESAAASPARGRPRPAVEVSPDAREKVWGDTTDFVNVAFLERGKGDGLVPGV